MTNKRDLKAYVRYDGSGRVIAGSLVLRRSKPKVGNWQEVQGYECCNQLYVLTVVPPSIGTSMSFTLKCDGVTLFYSESVGATTIEGVIINLNNNFSGLGTFTLVGNDDTIQLVVTSSLKDALCPTGTLTIECTEI